MRARSFYQSPKSFFVQSFVENLSYGEILTQEYLLITKGHFDGAWLQNVPAGDREWYLKKLIEENKETTTATPIQPDTQENPGKYSYLYKGARRGC